MKPSKTLWKHYPNSNTFLKWNDITSVHVYCSIKEIGNASLPLHTTMAEKFIIILPKSKHLESCLLYTSDAADEDISV